MYNLDFTYPMKRTKFSTHYLDNNKSNEDSTTSNQQCSSTSQVFNMNDIRTGMTFVVNYILIEYFQ